jgi:predicted cupin superfamily sugar epimerase
MAGRRQAERAEPYGGRTRRQPLRPRARRGHAGRPARPQGQVLTGLDLRDPATPAHAVLSALGLQPHPEGGHYRELWRDRPEDGGRGAATSILFLLAEGERSHWHRVDAAELWVWNAGGPLLLDIAAPGAARREVLLGPGVGQGQQVQAVVPALAWQAARPLGGWVLTTCVVAPAFEFGGFALAPPGWEPG